MAIKNEILVGRYNRFLQRLLSIKGGPPAPSLSSDIQAQFDIERIPTELRFLLGWTSWGSANLVAASAGNLSAMRLRNPPSSGVILVLEKAAADVAVTAVILLARQTTAADLGAGLSGATRDVRYSSPARSSVGVISVGNPAVTAGAQLAFFETSPQTFHAEFILLDTQEVVIAPGDTITIYSTVVNTAANITFFWRERATEEGELAAP